ncbi:hypothetical protein BH23BAC1_BH23BAC1_50660 [soil metagenome]
MFGLFKKSDKKDQLNRKYKALMKEYHQLSTQDRKAADMKMAEAEAVLTEMEKI